MIIQNLYKIIQYSLLLAGQEDDYQDRQLGPIHIIKYVYLADLAYAKSHRGETYTGIDWKFHKFGPWSNTVFSHLESALQAIDADKKVFPSDYEDREDWTRWLLIDDDLLYEMESQLPLNITARLRADVHKYSNHTPSLLQYVYSTEPMLNAAPGEYLDFSKSVVAKDEGLDDFVPFMRKLSEKKKRQFKNQLEIARQKNQEKLHRIHTQNKRVKPLFSPLYDSTFQEGMRWLDELAGKPFPTGEIEAEFDNSIWKSSARKLKDVS